MEIIYPINFKEELEMDEQIKEMMEEEIKAEIEHLSELEPGSEEKSKAIDVMSKLCRLNVEVAKVDTEADEKREAQECEEQFRREQIRQQVRERYVRIGIATAEIVLPLIFYGIWMRKGFKFEQDGTYTSTTFRGLFSKFKPTKK